MLQNGVAVLAKDMPFPADRVLSWIIWLALNTSILNDGVLRNPCQKRKRSLPCLPRAINREPTNFMKNWG